MDLKISLKVIMDFKNWIIDFFKPVLNLDPDFKESDSRILKITYKIG